ncbi:MAG: hypothetical protein KF764_31710 [Labilithrix sp.]|nr:hypothetical protein [Labilithrix sp.]
MKSGVPRLVACAAAGGFAFAGAATLAACGDDEAPIRRGFDVDAAPDADVPEPTPDAGADADGGVRRGPFDPADEPVTCADAGPCATRIVAGKSHFCALMSDGSVQCWGDDEYGALGAGDATDPDEPTDPAGAETGVRVVSRVTGAIELSAARATTCARDGEGSVWCWGSNSQGQLGLDDARPSWDELPHATPAKVALRDPALRVDVGPRSVCAVVANGGLVCWGTNEQGQLARESRDYVMGPATAELGTLAVARTSLGSATSLALTSGGDVFSWGAVAGRDGYLGGRMSSVSPDLAPNGIASLAKVTSLVVSDSLYKDEGGPLGVASIGPFPPPPLETHGHACAIADGEVYCWGRSGTGALCTGLPDNELLPAHAPVDGLAWPQQLAVGDEITCARMTDGTVRCCGAAAKGRLGAAQTEPFSAFLRPVSSFTGHAVQVATSHRAVCALVQGGTVQCWGSNARGELGTGSRDDDAHPVPVKVTFKVVP